MLTCSGYMPAKAQQPATKTPAYDLTHLPALIPYRVKNQWGFSDPSGNMIITPQYRKTTILSDSLFYGYDRSGDNQSYLYNTQGKVLAQYDGEPDFFITGTDDGTDDYDQLILFKKYPGTLNLAGRKSGFTGVPRYHIYDRNGAFHPDTAGYLLKRDPYNRFLPIGKIIGGKEQWGLIDSTGSRIETMRFAGILPYGNSYIRVKDSAGSLYGGFSGQPYYRWPFKTMDQIAEQIAEGIFLLYDTSYRKRRLFRFDGHIIATAGVAEQIKVLPEAPGYFMISSERNGRNIATLIDTAGRQLLVAADGYQMFGMRTGKNPAVVLVNKNSTSLYDFDGAYDLVTKRFLVNPNEGYHNITLLNHDWITFQRRSERTLYNLYTKEQLPLSPEAWQMVLTDSGIYARQSATGLTRDLGHPERKPVKVSTGFRELMRTGSGDKQGIFNLDTWQQVVPEQYDSLTINIGYAKGESYMPNITGTKGNGNVLFTSSGHQVLQLRQPFRVMASYRPYFIIETADSALVIDTTGRHIATVTKAKSYGFTLTGYAIANYATHASAISLSTGLPKNIDGTLSGISNGTVRKQFLYLEAVKDDKITLFDTRNFEQAVPYQFS